MEPLRSHDGFAYWGDNEGWLIAYAKHRDSEALDRSNFRCLQRELEAINDDDIAVESVSHWAVGWVEYLLVRPDTAAALAAEEWERKLEDYPVVDGEDWSNEEEEEAAEIIANEIDYYLRQRNLDIDHDAAMDVANWFMSEHRYGAADFISRSPNFDDDDYDRGVLAVALRQWRKHRKEVAA